MLNCTRKDIFPMETYQIDRFIKRVIELVKILFLSLKDIVMFVTWPVRRLLVNMTNVEVTRKLQQLQGQITEIRLLRLNDKDWDTNNPHKHDNYQSQIDMLARKINEALLNDEAYNKQFNRLENKVKALDSTNDYLNHDRYDTLEAKVDKLLSENSELTFIYDDEIREYPGEPDFHSEQKAMVKQMAEVAKRDEEND